MKMEGLEWRLKNALCFTKSPADTQYDALYRQGKEAGGSYSGMWGRTSRDCRELVRPSLRGRLGLGIRGERRQASSGMLERAAAAAHTWRCRFTPAAVAVSSVCASRLHSLLLQGASSGPSPACSFALLVLLESFIASPGLASNSEAPFMT